MILPCSSVLAGSKHNNDELPVFVLSGGLNGGCVLDHDGKPMRQLCRQFMSMMDVPPKSFGDAKMMLEEV